MTSLIQAVRQNKIEDVKRNLNQVQQTENGKTALIYAIIAKHIEIVSILAPYEADHMDDEGQGPLEYAQGNKEIIQILHEALGIQEESGEDVDGLVVK